MSVLVSTHAAVHGRSRLPGGNLLNGTGVDFDEMPAEVPAAVQDISPDDDAALFKFYFECRRTAGVYLLIVRDMPAWIVAEHRFVEVTIGMAATGITSLREAIDGYALDLGSVCLAQALGLVGDHILADSSFHKPH